MASSVINSGPSTAPTWYEVLDIPTHASPSDIAAAYERQRQLWDPTHGATMGDDFAEQAAERRTAIEAAYAVLSDPPRRFQYDESLGLVGTEATDRRGVSNREVIWVIGGVLVGLLVISLVYNLFASRSNQQSILNRFAVVDKHPAQPINLRTLDGQRFDLAAQRGKVVIVNFWGTWCEPCKDETPALQAAYAKLQAQGLVIVGVDMFDGERDQYNRTEAHVQAFTQRYGVTYPIALDDQGATTRAYQLYNIPVSYIVDPEGNVRYIRTGPMTVADVEQMFALLKRS